MALATEYGLALGHGVALASLLAIESAIYQHNRRASTGPRYRVGIASQPVDEYPIRELPLSGKERGDGMVFHEWRLTLATYGIKYLLDTFWASAATVSVAVTINTRLHWLATYRRYNAYMSLPQPGQSEEYLRQEVHRVVIRFTDLVAL